VRIAVADDGPGMDDAVRARAFEPFFTTKEVGQGTGLGLAQIHGFAHQSGGTALIDSAPGRGTEVSILLPPSGRTAAPQAARPDAAAVPAGQGETLLLVEDDAMVRLAVSRLLRDLGYDVVEAADADGGLAELARRPDVAGIITDLAMPGSMDGLGFAELVRRYRPGVPVLLTTGHLDPFGAEPLPGGVAFIQKPFTAAEIAQCLHGRLHLGRAPVPA
jgi:CheY-like chemotaxis protein